MPEYSTRAFPTPPGPRDPSDLPSSPEDDAARKDAARKIALRAAVLGVPLAIVAVLCLALGVPWWMVAGGIAVFIAIILFEV